MTLTIACILSAPQSGPPIYNASHVQLLALQVGEHLKQPYKFVCVTDSSWLRKVASLVGFDSVVLCGCPLSLGPYVGNHNLGGLMHRVDVVDNLFGQIEADTAWHEGVYSCSGRTKELLGEPC